MYRQENAHRIMYEHMSTWIFFVVTLKAQQHCKHITRGTERDNAVRNVRSPVNDVISDSYCMCKTLQVLKITTYPPLSPSNEAGFTASQGVVRMFRSP